MIDPSLKDLGKDPATIEAERFRAIQARNAAEKAASKATPSEPVQDALLPPPAADDDFQSQLQAASQEGYQRGQGDLERCKRRCQDLEAVRGSDEIHAQCEGQITALEGRLAKRSTEVETLSLKVQDLEGRILPADTLQKAEEKFAGVVAQRDELQARLATAERTLQVQRESVSSVQHSEGVREQLLQSLDAAHRQQQEQAQLIAQLRRSENEQIQQLRDSLDAASRGGQQQGQFINALQERGRELEQEVAAANAKITAHQGVIDAANAKSTANEGVLESTVIAAKSQLDTANAKIQTLEEAQKISRVVQERLDAALVEIDNLRRAKQSEVVVPQLATSGDELEKVKNAAQSTMLELDSIKPKYEALLELGNHARDMIRDAASKAMGVSEQYEENPLQYIPESAEKICELLVKVDSLETTLRGTLKSTSSGTTESEEARSYIAGYVGSDGLYHQPNARYNELLADFKQSQHNRKLAGEECRKLQAENYQLKSQILRDGQKPQREVREAEKMARYWRREFDNCSSRLVDNETAFTKKHSLLHVKHCALIGEKNSLQLAVSRLEQQAEKSKKELDRVTKDLVLQAKEVEVLGGESKVKDEKIAALAGNVVTLTAEATLLREAIPPTDYRAALTRSEYGELASRRLDDLRKRFFEEEENYGQAGLDRPTSTQRSWAEFVRQSKMERPPKDRPITAGEAWWRVRDGEEAQATSSNTTTSTSLALIPGVSNPQSASTTNATLPDPSNPTTEPEQQHDDDATDDDEDGEVPILVRPGGLSAAVILETLVWLLPYCPC